MDRYRLPETHVWVGQVLDWQRAGVRDAVRSWRLKCWRAAVYLVGGVGALLLFNRPFVWTPAMTAGACVTAGVGLLWVVWVGWLTGASSQAAIVGVNVLAFAGHVGVVVWGWLAYGPATAVPWLFAETGALGLVGGAVLYAYLLAGPRR
ncbi:hypothetical protein [Streptomyces sp. NPDC049881]|uniref:hypothetical protein n=1 Tax=Streptomyces sp. NPDC049881 TaxID=3155778 RepID=UPI00342BEE91